MTIARAILAAAFALGWMPAAFAYPRAPQVTTARALNVQLDCTGPRCLTGGPIRQPYLRGTPPSRLPGREMFNRAPPRPEIKLQQPEMDYRVPRFERDRPVVRDIRPPDPSFRAVGLPEQHVQWCFGRYRSYREADNSYQPFSGPRKACQSPFQ